MTRAGLAATMMEEPGWDVLRPFTPGLDPVGALAQELVATANGLRLNWTVTRTRRALEDGDGSRAAVGMRMHVRSRPIATMRFAPDDRDSVRALFVSQAMLEEQLRHRLDQLRVKVEWGTTVTTTTQDTDGGPVEFADGARVRTGWLAGCDGAHSTVREAAGIDFPGDRSWSSSCWRTCAPTGIATAPRRRVSSTARACCRRSPCAARTTAVTCGGSWPMCQPSTGASTRLARFEQLLPERAGETQVRIRDAVWTSVFRIHSPIGGP
jgi:2-polyprenyl-6-methoxyphenol hydroxylase-like FAD-dependent oxidoreductase